MSRIKRIDRCNILPFDQAIPQISQEPAGGEPGVVPDHEEGLNVLAVTLSQCGQQSLLVWGRGTQPALELIDDDEQTSSEREDKALPGRDERGSEVESGEQAGISRSAASSSRMPSVSAAVASMETTEMSSDRSGRSPAVTIEDLPEPDGPNTRPSRRGSRPSEPSIRDRQKPRISGDPFWSRGPGSRSWKKPASFRPKGRNPRGRSLSAVQVRSRSIRPRRDQHDLSARGRRRGARPRG